MHVLWILFVVSYFYVPAYFQYTEYSGCYDCNFAPSGYIRTSEGSAKEVGYVRCALLRAEDFPFVDAPPCTSGKCFIRLEDNGLEYRGCADPANLPLDVNPDVNCKYQGPGKPLWYFCEGHLCNYGQIGQDEDHCGRSPTPSYYSNEAGPSPIDEPPYESDDTSANEYLPPNSEDPPTNEYPVYDDQYQPVIVNNPDNLPPVGTGVSSSDTGYEQPSYSSNEELSYTNFYEPDDFVYNQPSQPNPTVWSKSGYNQYSQAKSGYNQPSHYKSGYNQEGNSKSGYNQPATKPDYNPSKSQTGKSDHTYSENHAGNSDASYGRGDVVYPQFPSNLQMHVKHPDDFLRQFGFWYFLMPVYWMNYFNYQAHDKYPSYGYEGDQIPEAKEYTGTSYNTVNNDNTYDNNYDSNYGDGYDTYNEDDAGYDTSAAGSLTQEYGRYNPCHGCDDNPSGLYEDVTRSGQFIQCGCAIYDGVPCTCCYPFPMTCPNNTMFSDVTKTCVRFGNYPQYG